MKVVLHDRTEGLRPEVHEYAQSKLSRLARHFGKVAEAEVEFSEERKRGGLTMFVCRILVHLDGRRSPVLSAHETAADAQAALDLALDKIDRQVVKQKEKVTHRKQAVSPIRVPQQEPTARRRSDEPDRIFMKLHPMPLQQAIDELESDGENFRVFLNEDSGDIQIVFRRSDGSVAVIEPVIT